MQGNEEDAQDAFRKAIEVDPLYVSPYGVLAELKLRVNEVDEAARLASKGIELNPYEMSTHYINAIAQYYLGNLEKAVASIEKIQGSSEAHRFPTSHRLLGSIYAEQKKYIPAAKEFHSFLATNPPDEEAEEVNTILKEWEKAGLLPSS
jgi:tetratricopeptide (TPR) repeat protein